MGKISRFCFNFCRPSHLDLRASGRRRSLTNPKTATPDSNNNDPANKNAVKSTTQSPNPSSSSSMDMAAEKYKEELKAMKEELEDLRRKFLEKDEHLKSIEESKNSTSAQSPADKIPGSTSEKDALIKSTQLQLEDAKTKLAEKQASVEKLEWEKMSSKQKVEKLEEELNSLEAEISSFMLLFEGLTMNNSTPPAQDYDIKPLSLDRVPEIDDMEESGMRKMEAAKQAYVAAVGVAKEKQDEESLTAAARARLHLHSFVFKTDV